MIGNCSIIAFLFVFPNGRFVPRWTMFVLIAWILYQLPRYYLPDSPLNLMHSSPGLYNLLFPIGVLTGLGSQIYRYRGVSNATERQQTKWVIYGLAIGIGAYIILRFISLRVPNPLGNDLPIALGLNIAAIFFMLLIPISISIAVIRFRLWDINPIINRTLVYGTLSALTISFYILVVGLFANYFQQRSANYIISFLATGVVAILFEPLRKRLQRAVNRLMYGERDDPTTVLMRLSTRIDSALAPDTVLQTIVETLAQTLRLPYVAISLLDDAHAPRFASTIQPTGQDGDLLSSELIHIPLTYQNRRVGALILAPRAHGESFSTADVNLLNIIAGQAGIAAHNLRLTHDLQRSREKLVTAQEEERRRLRRDLHDGVGPTLASLAQRLDTAAGLVSTDPRASVELLKDLKGQVKSTVAEIRRLVYALRPPVLDEFGLVSSIREHIAPYTGPKGLQVTFDVGEPMPLLPAAVEVAAYRIALEAFTNIINHAEASQCNIKININNGSLLLEVSDNGKGLADRNHTGVGLTSMHERASELGGECVIENSVSGGTCVRARLPINPSAAVFMPSP
jgi:signal transduction histidine kinase